MSAFLETDLSAAKLDVGLAQTICTIADAVAAISSMLRGKSIETSAEVNTFGDQQLNVDVETDKIVFDKLRSTGRVKMASSEEQTEPQDLQGHGYSVAFDPLDGSSIIGANFAVGSIFGIWPGDDLISRKGSEQVAAMYAVYGPRTVLVVAWRQTGMQAQVQEYILSPDLQVEGQWQLHRSHIRIGEKAVFAPANLRCSCDNKEYQQLMQYWMGHKYTLRYSGGMVPDVHHILTKGGGVFANPTSESAPAKLRLLYECAPLAFIVEAAGGLAECSTGSVLDIVIANTDIRTNISLGSCSEVIRSRLALAE